MEQKRTIWIVLAAGIFLMVVIGAAVILYAPEARKDTTALVQKENGTVWMSPEVAQHKKDELMENSSVVSAPVEDVKAVEDTSVVSSIATPAEGTTQIENMTVIATGNTNVYSVGADGPATIDLNNVREVADEPAVKAQNRAAEAAIRETNTVRRNVEVSDVLVENSYKDVSKATASSNVRRAERSSSANVSAPVKKAAPAAKKTEAKAPAKVERIPDRFWVQAASYSAKKNADEARSVLEQKKIQCEVFTFTDAKGTLYYRVRVGPYTTRKEAEYWKKKIDEIPLFSKNGSFVTNSSAAK
ncbi:MAG: SPOR domain-containing protein [Spirochaetia bacterium]|nr:SPOR domain-containing protein [uncultured Treponema sp.]MCI7578228.1 SPOR domain-containing protein [Spirochaetia bacterium]